MQGLVAWWCNLIGVTDSTSIQIATGIVSAATALVICWLAIMVVIRVVGAWLDRG
jgi:hypothetical protein